MERIMEEGTERSREREGRKRKEGEWNGKEWRRVREVEKLKKIKRAIVREGR